MSFRLRNTAQTFQRFIDEMIHNLDFAYAYIDDILVVSSFEDEQRDHIRQLFKRLSEYGIVVNLNKCVLGASEVSFPGYTVSTAGITPLQDRVKAFMEFPTPVTIQELRRFLGTINLYRRFIPLAVDIQSPLHRLLEGKNKKGKEPLH